MANVKELVHTIIKETCTHWICADDQELDRVEKELEQKLNDLVNSERALADSSHEATAALPLQNVSGSASKNELIQQLLKKLYEDSDNNKKLEYQSKIACGYGIVTLTINVE
jgi:hypothetical protein